MMVGYIEEVDDDLDTTFYTSEITTISFLGERAMGQLGGRASHQV
jgi:hypothetical protein